MYAIYMVTFTIHIPQMLVYIAYMDPMGIETIETIIFLNIGKLNYKESKNYSLELDAWDPGS